MNPDESLMITVSFIRYADIAKLRQLLHQEF
jgi:hypothetical protein